MPRYTPIIIDKDGNHELLTFDAQNDGKAKKHADNALWATRYYKTWIDQGQPYLKDKEVRHFQEMR